MNEKIIIYKIRFLGEITFDEESNENFTKAYENLVVFLKISGILVFLTLVGTVEPAKAKELGKEKMAKKILETVTKTGTSGSSLVIKNINGIHQFVPTQMNEKISNLNQKELLDFLSPLIIYFQQQKPTQFIQYNFSRKENYPLVLYPKSSPVKHLPTKQMSTGATNSNFKKLLGLSAFINITDFTFTNTKRIVNFTKKRFRSLKKRIAKSSFSDDFLVQQCLSLSNQVKKLKPVCLPEVEIKDWNRFEVETLTEMETLLCELRGGNLPIIGNPLLQISEVVKNKALNYLFHLVKENVTVTPKEIPKEYQPQNETKQTEVEKKNEKERKAFLFHFIDFLRSAPGWVTGPVIIMIYQLVTHPEIFDEFQSMLKRIMNQFFRQSSNSKEEKKEKRKKQSYLEWIKEKFFHSLNPTKKEFYIALFVFTSVYYLFFYKKMTTGQDENLITRIFATIDKQTEYIVKISEDTINRISKFGSDFQNKNFEMNNQNVQKIIALETDVKTLTESRTEERVYSAGIAQNLNSCIHELAEQKAKNENSENLLKLSHDQNHEIKKVITELESKGGNENSLVVVQNNLTRKVHEITSKPVIIKKANSEEYRKALENRWVIPPPEQQKEKKKK